MLQTLVLGKSRWSLSSVFMLYMLILAPSVSLAEMGPQRPCCRGHWLLCKQVLWTEGRKDTVEDRASCSGGRCLSSHLKVTCSPPCRSSRCCRGCNIWQQSTRGRHPSIVLWAASGAMMRGHWLGGRASTKRQTAPAPITPS